MQSLPATNEPGHKVAGCRTLGALGLLLTHWWAELVSEVGGCGASVPGSSVSLLVGGDSC